VIIATPAPLVTVHRPTRLALAHAEALYVAPICRLHVIRTASAVSAAL
jgi:hypothetical protein